MKISNEYKKAKLTAGQWKALAAIVQSGHRGTREFVGWPEAIAPLVKLKLADYRRDRDALLYVYATSKGKWWSHWRRTAGVTAQPLDRAKQPNLF